MAGNGQRQTGRRKKLHIQEKRDTTEKEEKKKICEKKKGGRKEWGGGSLRSKKWKGYKEGVSEE